MSDSVPPQRRQPTRLCCPWDSPGKNTGVGCHFLLQCMKVKSKSEVAQSGPTLIDPMDCSLPGSSIHGIFRTRVLEWGAIAFSSLGHILPGFSPFHHQYLEGKGMWPCKSSRHWLTLMTVIGRGRGGGAVHTWLKTFQPLTFSQLLENECFHPEKVAYHWVSFPCCLLSYALSFSITLVAWPFLGVACDQTGGSHCHTSLLFFLDYKVGLVAHWKTKQNSG